MGQRHQFFAIARIGNRYRVVAGVHNQWLYGPIAVRQCLNTMRVLSASGNLPGIRRELKLAQTKPDDFWPDKSTKKNSDSSDRVSRLSLLQHYFLYLLDFDYGRILRSYLNISAHYLTTRTKQP